MNACGSESEGGDAVRGCNDVDEEPHAAAVVFEGVPNFEIISNAGTMSSEGPETLTVRCISLGDDGKLLINTIEVTTDELRSMRQISSEEMEFVYAPNNMQFQMTPIDDNPDDSIGNENGLVLANVEEIDTLSKIPAISNSDIATIHDDQEPRLVIQHVGNTDEVVTHGTSMHSGDIFSYVNHATPPPPPNCVTLTTIDGKRISFNSCGPELIKFTHTQSQSSTYEEENANIILTTDIQELEQQIPVIIKTATLAQKTVTAELASHSNNLDKKNEDTSNTGLNPSLSSAATVQIEVSEGNVLEFKKFYYQPGLCRVLTKDNLTSIFEDVNFDTNGRIENTRGPNAPKFHLYTALKTMLDIEVEYNDGLPPGICTDCYDNLMNFSAFRKQIAIGQAKLNQILEQVKNSNTPTFIPPLGESRLEKVDIYKNSLCIVKANELLKKSQYSHLVVRNISYRIWDKIFTSMSQVVGFKSGKLKTLEPFACEAPYVSGYFCCTCSTTIYGTKEDFAGHLYNFHGVTSREDVHYPCDICGNSYPVINYSSSMLQSYAEHWLQHFFMHECNFCNKKLPSSKGLWVHKKSLHSRKEKSFVCNTEGCTKRFHKKSQLDCHKASHITSSLSDDVEIRREHSCNECNKCFSSASSLIVHITSVHGNERRWKCDVFGCPKQFKRKEGLLAHKETVHLNLRKYECEICGDKFKSQSSKNVHILRHKGEKHHICTVCFKEFYTLNGLKSHMLKHQDSGEFQCDACPKIFKRAAYLREHKRIHTGEKPFSCNLCHRDFRMKSNYFKHMRIHRRKSEIL